MFEILKLFQEGSLSSHANSSSRRGTLTIRYAAFRRLRRYPHRADHWRRTGNRRCGRYSLRTKSHALRVARRYNWARSGGRVPVDQTARSRCHVNKLKRPGSGARCQLSALVRVIGGFLEERTYNVAKANDRLWSQTACGAVHRGRAAIQICRSRPVSPQPAQFLSFCDAGRAGADHRFQDIDERSFFKLGMAALSLNLARVRNEKRWTRDKVRTCGSSQLRQVISL